MNCYELHANEGLNAVVLTSRSQPALDRPGLVRVQIHSVSLNYRDLLVARGAKAAAQGKPIVPLSDGAGVVIEVGSDCSRFKVGDRVMAAFFPSWQEGEFKPEHHTSALGGGSTDGLLAEEVVLPESAWVKIPDHLSFDEASCLPCAGLTAYHALFQVASLQPGQTVLLQGTGGVSSMALQLAKAAGAVAIVTTSSDEKGKRAQAMGASHIVNYKRNANWGKSIYELVGAGVDLAVDVGGPETFDQTAQALRTGGAMSVVGVLTGFAGTVNTSAILAKMLTIRGVYVGSVNMFEKFNRLLSVHRIAPIIDRVFAFDQARDAYAYLASAAHFGKVVIQVRAPSI
jgi:NADPH:quinone reductase-like Zn-dependent oxidoreductase